ncbi:signal recognition particle-docking protein FtsY [Candidatus Bathyarchaeota archaeon]|nr:signal recognition particle-docking protein FtsY [Candidatus Bathyarchaeota archaeon]
MFERLKKAFSKAVDRLSYGELSPKELEEAVEEFKLSLLESDVALAVAERVGERLKEKLSVIKIRRFGDNREVIKEAMKATVLELLETPGKRDLEALIKGRRVAGNGCPPFVIVFVGVNGSGKTLTIAKVASYLQRQGFTVALACADTFRAGAIEQLEILASRLGVKAIRHRYGGDAAAVVFDAIQYAKAHGIDVVLVDTAGRMQTRRNLMEEMQKIVRIAKPDLTVFVGDALTGNDAINQAEEFSKYVPIDGAILTKMDADAKGGSAISIVQILKKPILFLGVGSNLDDLEPFDPKAFVDRIIEA